MVNRSKQLLAAETLAGWQKPDVAGLDLQFRMTRSVLDEFVEEHDASDVLRELVQNEFDARGTRLEIVFGADSLSVRGNGMPIDAAGWKRLSVMLGQGRVAGSDLIIKPKTNGIGSKNFGLKSLFSFGPQIFIRSAGLQTVLDYQRGTLPKPRPEPDSKRKRGVEIQVPYRAVAEGNLVPFGLEQEKTALSQFAQSLIPTLIKLVVPDSPKQLKRLVVKSERHDQRIRWTQSAEKIDCSARYVTAIERTLRVVRSRLDNSNSSQQTIREIEFQKSFKVPEEFRRVTFPSYFRASSRSRVKIGISVRMKGSQIDLSHRGQLFYPIGVPDERSGNGISISAPFKMDMDRSAILGDDPWNQLLLQCAADLTMDVLTSDWLDRFGATAYLVSRPNETLPENCKAYCTAISEYLASEECWPTRDITKGKNRRTALSQASGVVIPDAEELDEFLSPVRYLNLQFAADERVRRMAMEFGAKRFTINSLIRLRCAGTESGNLTTRLDQSEANYMYIEYPNDWANVERQKRFAHALDVFTRKLSRQNREDLGQANTTLNDAGGLSAPNTPLWVVQGDIAPAVDLEPTQRLHSDLCQYKVLPKLCETFDIKSWVRRTTEEVRSDTASPNQRDALYAYVIERSGQFDQTTKALLKRSPILKTARDDWATPESIIDERTRNAEDLRPVLNFPHPEYAKDVELAKALSFKKKITGADLVAYAGLVQQNPEMAESCANTLWKMRRLFDPKIIAQLSTLPFLRNTLGGLTSPLDTYLPTDLNLACLGSEAAFVKGGHRSLYEQLGCLSAPRSEDIISYIERLRESGDKPENAKVLYAALVRALESEGELTDSYEYDHILWAEGGFHQPSEILVGRGYRKIFRGIIPQLVARSGCVPAARELGANSEPHPQHWRTLLQWFSNRFGETDDSIPLTLSHRTRLREVYAALQSPPAGIDPNMRFLLGTNGRLYSQVEASQGILLINDDPQLAAALDASQSTVAFADTSRLGSLRFFTEASVKNLTEVRYLQSVQLGETVAARERVNFAAAIQKVRSDEFGSAFSRLVEYDVESDQAMLRPLDLLEELKKRSDITFVDKLQVAYTVSGQTVYVDEEIVAEDDRFVAIRASSNRELRGRLSSSLAGLVTENPVLRRSLADSTYRLLDSPTTHDMEHYLNGRGIPWEWGAGAVSEPWEDQWLESDIEQGGDEIDDAVSRMLGESLGSRIGQRSAENDGQRSVSNRTSDRDHNEPTVVSPTNRRSLPPIAEVAVRQIPREGTVHVRRPQQTRSSGSTSGWSPPTREQEEWDREVGRRGEELVYRSELKRVKKLGYPESRVEWISDQKPGADHDIRSVNCNGEDLYIEVKSTTGKDGRFQWSKNEFDLARSLRDRYVLYRVYEVDSKTPSMKSFRDPVGLLLQNALRLDVSSLNAEVESLQMNAV